METANIFCSVVIAFSLEQGSTSFPCRWRKLTIAVPSKITYRNNAKSDSASIVLLLISSQHFFQFFVLLSSVLVWKEHQILKIISGALLKLLLYLLWWLKLFFFIRNTTVGREGNIYLYNKWWQHAYSVLLKYYFAKINIFLVERIFFMVEQKNSLLKA